MFVSFKITFTLRFVHKFFNKIYVENFEAIIFLIFATETTFKKTFDRNLPMLHFTSVQIIMKQIIMSWIFK